MVAYEFLPSCPGYMLPLFLLVFLCLLAVLFTSSGSRILCLLVTFFLTGIILEQTQHRPSQVMPLAVQRKIVNIEGTVLDPIKVINKMARLKVRAHRLFIEGKSMAINENLLVSVYDHVVHFRPGDKIYFPARLRPFRNFNNPGRYDYESAMKLKGFSCAASVSDGRFVVPMGTGHMPFPGGLLERIKRPVRNFFKEKLNSQNYALYCALILGEHQGIDHDFREPFNKTGLGHMLAVSGLHIGLVAWMAFSSFKGILSRSYKLALKTDVRKLAALLTCVPVIGYVLLAGCQVSSQRAMIMALVFLWSFVLGRERDVWSTLALGALLILAIDPHAIFGIPFQLSFSAVTGILWFMPLILDMIPKSDKEREGVNGVLDRLLVYFVGLIGMTLCATIFILPIISFYFHRISLVSIPANITVMPLLGLWVIPLGLLCCATLPFFPQLAEVFVQLGAWGLNIMTEMIRFWSNLPFSSLWTITPNFFEAAIYYSLILLIFSFKRLKWAKTGILILAFLTVVDIGYWTLRVCFNRDLRVTFLDVGQANAALVEFPGGKKMLIDGGGLPRGSFDVGRMVVAPYLWHSKILHIDYLVLSHPQADHMNGLRFIARAFDPEEFWYNGDERKTPAFMELMTIIESKQVKNFLPANLAEGREINGARIEVLHPDPSSHSPGLFDGKARFNDNSLVLKVSYEGRSFLFPGDLEQPGEDVLISNAGNALRSDILLSPHHGSRSSSSEEFLRIVAPTICVISSGEGNFFGFPHEQTISRLQDIGCIIVRIDMVGAVKCTVGAGKFEVRTFMQGDDDFLRF
ncbi:MAG: DNA internalization-related competence protein ComEC/Rec2 [Thermodesulfobacteriota bacterium]|nr:DNA internalization-related competence protein ComEC/Rec2 [Thermodesulfobacteriota bacterium]